MRWDPRPDTSKFCSTSYVEGREWCVRGGKEASNTGWLPSSARRGVRNTGSKQQRALHIGKLNLPVSESLSLLEQIQMNTRTRNRTKMKYPST